MPTNTPGLTGEQVAELRSLPAWMETPVKWTKVESFDEDAHRAFRRGGFTQHFDAIGEHPLGPFVTRSIGGDTLLATIDSQRQEIAEWLEQEATRLEWLAKEANDGTTAARNEYACLIVAGLANSLADELSATGAGGG